MSSLRLNFFFWMFSLSQLSLVSNMGHTPYPICFLKVHLLSILRWRKNLDLDRILKTLKEDKYVRVHRKACAKNAPGDSSCSANSALRKQCWKKPSERWKRSNSQMFFSLIWTILRVHTTSFRDRECKKFLPRGERENMCTTPMSHKVGTTEISHTMRRINLRGNKKIMPNGFKMLLCSKPQFSSWDPRNLLETPADLRAKEVNKMFEDSRIEAETSIFTEAGPSSWMYFSKHRFTIAPAKLWKYPENIHLNSNLLLFPSVKLSLTLPQAYSFDRSLSIPTQSWATPTSWFHEVSLRQGSTLLRRTVHKLDPSGEFVVVFEDVVNVPTAFPAYPLCVR